MKILVIRFSSIGDIVLTFPVIKALRKAYPNSEIFFAVKEQFTNVLSVNSDIDRIVPLTMEHQKGIRKLFAYIKELNNQNFDIVIDLHSNLRSKLITTFLRAGKKVCYNKDHIRRKLMIYFKKFPSEKTHTVDKYLSALKKVGIEAKEREPQILPKERDIQFIDDFFRANQFYFDKNLIAINPNAANFTKMWQWEKFSSLAKSLVEERGVKVVIIGGKEDVQRNERVIRAADLDKGNTISTAGKVSLAHLPALLSRCELLITNDSAPMHIAAAVGTPVVAFFGPTVQEFGFFPLGENHTVIEREITCRPCSLHGSKTCPKGHFRCMEEISVNDVLTTIYKKYLN